MTRFKLKSLKKISMGLIFFGALVPLQLSLAAFAADAPDLKCSGDLVNDSYPEKSGYYLLKVTTNEDGDRIGDLGFNLCTETYCLVERVHTALSCISENNEGKAICTEAKPDPEAYTNYEVELSDCEIVDGPMARCATVSLVTKMASSDQPSRERLGILECTEY